MRILSSKYIDILQSSDKGLDCFLIFFVPFFRSDIRRNSNPLRFERDIGSVDFDSTGDLGICELDSIVTGKQSSPLSED